MDKAAASSPLEDLDLSGEEVQRLTSAFQDPEFRRMFSEYAEELTDPENRRRYEAEITALERERGVEVQFVHPEPGHVLRTSLDGARRCYVNVCSNALYTVYDVVFHPDALALARRHERFRQMLDATALEAVEKQFGVKLDHRNAKTLKIKYKGTPEAAVLRTPLPGGVPARPEGEPESSFPDFPYPELVVTIELPLLRSAEQAALEVTGKLLCLDSRKPDYQLRLSLPYPVDDSRGKAQFNKARRQLVVTLPVAPSAARREPLAPPEEPAGAGTDSAGCTSAREGGTGPAEGRAGEEDAGITTPDAAGEELVSEPERDFGGQAVATAGIEEKPLPGTGSSPGDLDGGPPAGGGSVCGGLSVGTRVAREDSGREPSDPAMDGPGTDSRRPLCPPLQCRQDEESLTLLILVPRIQPQSLQGDVSSLRYKLCFSTQDLVYYSFFLQFAPENKLSIKEPVVSISSNNAVIELAKSSECYGHWREWYYGLNNDSLEERLFVNEENVNEFLEEVLSPPFQQTIPLTSPLIEVLQVTDSKIQIHTKLQECSNSAEQLHEKEEKVNEGSHPTKKKEHPTTSTTASDSSIAVKVLELDSCGSVEYLQQDSLDVSQIFGKSQQPESKMEEKGVYSSEEKDNLKEPVITEEEELTVQNIPGFDNIKETNMQDGSVQIIKDHVTHCAFSFQNSLLYDLD
ncbi:PREDICTED: protein kintoun [Myotis davidii]|uniref:protein kintoun n=1 Tax=Myotis davidii TaxID=225400 RepID=UPI0003EBDA4F|nr:PREDICTED: protein kintoun [Myotis davidii]